MQASMRVDESTIRPKISVVTPAFNEAENLPILYRELTSAISQVPGVDWEWVIIDDASTDATLSVIKKLAKDAGNVSGIRLSRNFGSHLALTCGLHHVSGDAAILLAADLQDPPSVIPELIKVWVEGAKVVWACRDHPTGVSRSARIFSGLYHKTLSKLSGLNTLPSSGADFFLIDKDVIAEFRGFHESNISLFALIAWLGFEQKEVAYTKRERAFGESGWSFSKKVKLFTDSIVGFSALPLRIISAIGMLLGISGLAYAVFVIANAFFGAPPEGWTTLTALVLILGGFQMCMTGLLGEYLWRSLEQARRRPLYVIDQKVGSTTLS